MTAAKDAVAALAAVAAKGCGSKSSAGAGVSTGSTAMALGLGAGGSGRSRSACKRCSISALVMFPSFRSCTTLRIASDLLRPPAEAKIP
eukprot:scaffold1237_cov243-Pinguiococcus_pyrenoidosus.AAC.52